MPFIITDNAGRPILWNEPVIGIPLPDYQILLQREHVQAPSNPVILEILSLAAAYDQDQRALRHLHATTASGWAPCTTDGRP